MTIDHVSQWRDDVGTSEIIDSYSHFPCFRFAMESLSAPRIYLTRFESIDAEVVDRFGGANMALEVCAYEWAVLQSSNQTFTVLTIDRSDLTTYPFTHGVSRLFPVTLST